MVQFRYAAACKTFFSGAESYTRRIASTAPFLGVDSFRLVLVSAPEKKVLQDAAYLSRSTRKAVDERKNNFKPDIDVRGMRGDEALRTVMSFVDDAQLLGVARIRILHGTGTGALREVIRQYLRTVPGNVSFHDEHVQFGGSGITVVDFQ